MRMSTKSRPHFFGQMFPRNKFLTLNIIRYFELKPISGKSLFNIQILPNVSINFNTSPKYEKIKKTRNFWHNTKINKPLKSEPHRHEYISLYLMPSNGVFKQTEYTLYLHFRKR